MQKLVEESKRAAAVVRRLRDFFRSGATRLETISMSTLAAQVIESLRHKALAAHVAVNCRSTDNLPPVMVDAVQIEVVLRNLLLNAIDSAAQAAPSGGEVTVRIETGANGAVIVSVQDNGPGIREADAQRLFESFVTTKTSGMGMGLAISRAIIEAHGGQIWAVPGGSGLLCFTIPPATT